MTTKIDDLNDKFRDGLTWNGWNIDSLRKNGLFPLTVDNLVKWREIEHDYIGNLKDEIAALDVLIDNSYMFINVLELKYIDE